MNIIRKIVRHSEYTAEVVIENPSIARSARAGHFVMVRFTPDCPRIPFTIVDASPADGTFTLIIHKGARLADLIGSLHEDYRIGDVLGPLGQAFEIRNYGTVVCCGDGVGFVPIIPVIKAFKQAGNRVVTILSEFTSETSCLRANVEPYSDVILHSSEETATLELIDRVLTDEKVDLTVITGPTPMMKAIAECTRVRQIPTRCILNMVMLDGVGLCGICRVMVDGKRMLTCIDGPVFDAHHVDFDQLQNRQRHFV